VLTETEQPYDRIKIKFKFTSGQYHIHEIGQTYSLDSLKSMIYEYIDMAKEILEIDDSVDVEYVRALRTGEDEAVD